MGSKKLKTPCTSRKATMRRSNLIVAALICMNAAWAECRAGLIPISASQFAPDAQVIGFETGTTALPTIPGVTFLSTSSTSYPWYGGGAEFDSFGPAFGSQTWENFLGGNQSTIIYSGLGLDLATPVQAIGGYVAKVPNSNNLSPSQVVVELFDSSMNSLGTSTITLNVTDNVPVFFGFTASAPIATFTIVAPTPGAGFFGVDNFTYGSLQSVPEPSSLVLAGMATVAGLGIWSRRRGR
jgi:hypothetical protein